MKHSRKLNDWWNDWCWERYYNLHDGKSDRGFYTHCTNLATFLNRLGVSPNARDST